MTQNQHGRMIDHLGKMKLSKLFRFEIFYDPIKQDDKCVYYNSSQD